MVLSHILPQAYPPLLFLWFCLLRGQDHYGAVPLDGAYFGCLSRFTTLGVSLVREAIHPALLDRLSVAHQNLREFDDV
ncbi:MAG: hypothetical protein ACLUNZ_12430 [Evtepia sp.]